MLLLIKNARILDGTDRIQDILIRNGRIEAIDRQISASDAEIWESPNLCVSPGWLDVGVFTADPGFEHREDLRSASAAAAAGGFTAIACFPNTEPALHTKAEILYVKSKTAGLPVRCYPMGAVSQECKGKDLAELYDMHNAGAIAFSDGHHAVQDAGLLLRALQYVKAFKGLVINVPHHKTVSAGGQMHEGLMSTSLGLKGIPALAETLMVQRDLSLLEYAESRLHIHLISTAKSVELIRAAKKAGLPVTCSVAVANLCFTDEMLKDFDSNWKLMPPVRSTKDMEALREGVLDGTIDMVCSNHVPWDEEAKNLEFPYAEFGMSALETAFSLCATYLSSHIPLPVLIRKLSNGPRKVLNLPAPAITVGEKADLSVFDPEMEWTPESKQLKSRAFNTPFLGKTLKGKVLGIVTTH